DPLLDGSALTAAADILGTVAGGNIDSWSLDVAPLGTNAFVALAGGTAPVANGPLARFDPAAVPNGFYRLRLTVTDLDGRTATAEAVVEARSADKPARYLRTETDLTVTLGGVAVSVVRRYDSLTAGRAGVFGVGWQFAGREVAPQTDVPPTGHEAQGVYNAFRPGTRLYLPLPDGRRAGFTFAPVKHELPGVTWYTPAWQADAGVE